MAHWATTYIQQTVHVTQGSSYIFTSLVTETRTRQVLRRLYDSSIQHATPQQMWRTVTAIFTRLTAETWWQKFFRRLRNSDAPSQLISFVLVTASIALLGSEIPSRQTISCLTVETLGASDCWSGSIYDIAISLSPSRQVRNGSLLTWGKLHLL